MSAGAELDNVIATEEARLVELDRSRDATRARLADLRALRERHHSGGGTECEAASGDAWTPQRKVALFASLFRGRDDVFPVRWERPAKGRSGWSPRCANEWKTGVCAKPRVRCGSCPNQAFVKPVEDELVAHLRGRQVMGVYPLLADDTTWLLAIDLDGRSWRADVAALREACSARGVVPAVERSRSGKGAHVWFFFSAPVPAGLARCFGLMLLTEAMARTPTHHVPAVMTERVLQSAPARYVTGLTATPHRRDGHHPIIRMQCGPVRHTIGGQATGSPHTLELRVIRRDTSFDPSGLPTDAGIQEIYGALTGDERRTELIAGDALELVAQGRSPIVLTERREHLERLTARLADHVSTLITLHGAMRPAAHRDALEQLRAGDDVSPRLVVATGRYIGEGFDDPRLDALLLAMPIAWKGTVVQYAGRLHRAHPGKCQALVYDYVDGELPVLRRMFAKRLKAYRALGYELAEAA